MDLMMISCKSLKSDRRRFRLEARNRFPLYLKCKKQNFGPKRDASAKRKTNECKGSPPPILLYSHSTLLPLSPMFYWFFTPFLPSVLTSDCHIIRFYFVLNTLDSILVVVFWLILIESIFSVQCFEQSRSIGQSGGWGYRVNELLFIN